MIEAVPVVVAQQTRKPKLSLTAQYSVTCMQLQARRALLRSRMAWDRFDPYSFDKLKKLDRSAAARSITHLRQLQEIRDAQIRDDRKRREVEKAKRQRPGKTLRELLDEFLRLHAGDLKPQARGYALERILVELRAAQTRGFVYAHPVSGAQKEGKA